MKLKDVTYKTEINKLYKYQIEKIVDLALDWCITTFGVRKWCPSFTVDVVKEAIGNGAGWYLPFRHDPEISINANANIIVMDLIDTTIHEYSHYLQKDFRRHYDQLSTEYEYHNHPLEIEAKDTAKKYRRICFTTIKKSF